MGSRRALGLLLVVAPLLAANPGFAAEPVRVGESVPDFTLPTLGGGSVTLSSRRDVGPTVLVFFRGVW